MIGCLYKHLSFSWVWTRVNLYGDPCTVIHILIMGIVFGLKGRNDVICGLSTAVNLFFIAFQTVKEDNTDYRLGTRRGCEYMHHAVSADY